MKTKTLTLMETKARCAFYGYSVKKECGEFRAYPKGKPELDFFETDGWSLYLTCKATALQSFQAKLNACPLLNDTFKPALLSWFESERAAWKDRLERAWCGGNYGRHEYQGELQRLRNSPHGHEIIFSL